MKQKRDFLLSKGLTNQEIDEACSRAGIAKDSDVIVGSPTSSNGVVARLPPPPGYPVVVHGGPTWLQSFRDVLHLVVLLGGAAYGCYYLWRVSSFRTNKQTNKEGNIETKKQSDRQAKKLDKVCFLLTEELID
jgi:hypothetical protein